MTLSKMHTGSRCCTSVVRLYAMRSAKLVERSISVGSGQDDRDLRNEKQSL